MLKPRRAASSMIAVGLSWKMAIGACVLGNAIMGIIITINGRIGATVSRPLTDWAAYVLTQDSFTRHSRSSRACRLARTLAISSSCPAASSPWSGSGMFARVLFSGLGLTNHGAASKPQLGVNA